MQPITDIPLTEPRWVRAVEMRPATQAGRRITHHALAYLLQDEPGGPIRPAVVIRALTMRAAALLMEWAVGKQFDIYRPNTGKLLLPGAQIWWDIALSRGRRRDPRPCRIGRVSLSQRRNAEVSDSLTMFNAAARAAPARYSANTIAETEAFPRAEQAARLENFQPHMHLRGKAMLLEAILPDGTVQTVSYCRQFQLQLDDQLHLCRRCGAGVAEGHDHPCEGVA